MVGYLVIVKRYEERAKLYAGNTLGVALSPHGARDLFVNTERVANVQWIESRPGEVWRAYYVKKMGEQAQEFAAYIIKTDIRR